MTDIGSAIIPELEVAMMRACDLLASLHEQTRQMDKTRMDPRNAHDLNDASSMALWATVAVAQFVAPEHRGADLTLDLETPPLTLATTAYELMSEHDAGLHELERLRLLDWVGTICRVLKRHEFTS